MSSNINRLLDARVDFLLFQIDARKSQIEHEHSIETINELNAEIKVMLNELEFLESIILCTQ